MINCFFLTCSCVGLQFLYLELILYSYAALKKEDFVSQSKVSLVTEK